MKGRRSDTPLIWLLIRAALLAAVWAAAVALMRRLRRRRRHVPEAVLEAIPVTPSYAGGAGTPLVLLHGVGGTWRVWRPVLPLLERWHAVFAPTLPGHCGAERLAPGVVPSIQRARRRGRRAARSSWDRSGAHRRQLARRVDRPGAGPPRTGPVGRPLRPRRCVAVGGAHDRRRRRDAAVVRHARQAGRPRGGDRPSAVGAATAARDAGRTPRPRRPGRVRGLDPGDEGLPRGRPAAAGDHEAPAGTPARGPGLPDPGGLGGARPDHPVRAQRPPSAGTCPGRRARPAGRRGPRSDVRRPGGGRPPHSRGHRRRRPRPREGSRGLTDCSPTFDRARRAEWHHRMRTTPPGAARRT